MRRFHLAVPVFVCLLTLVAASGLIAYTLNTHGAATWTSTPQLVVDQRGLSSVDDVDGGITAVIDAVTSPSTGWNATWVGTVITAVAGDVSMSADLTDGIPMLRFDDPQGICTGNCLGKTNTRYIKPASGHWFIKDAEIVTNTTHSWTSLLEDPASGDCSGEAYVDAVHVHEAGHLLGLDHSTVSGATMYSSTSYCAPDMATITLDDDQGIRDLYTGNPNCLGSGFSCGSGSDCCSGTCNKIVMPWATYKLCR